MNTPPKKLTPNTSGMGHLQRPAWQNAMPRRPVAPPAYLSQLKPKPIQPQMANGALNRKPPVVPPVYRPQPVTKVLQTKRSSVPNQRAAQTPRPPVAPPVYRPQAKEMVQPKAITLLRRAPVAPPVYRPEQKRIAQPKIASAPARMAPKTSHRVNSLTIQRQIMLDDSETFWDEIMNLPFAHHLGDVEQEILRRWVNQRTIHRFTSDPRSTAVAKLFAAAEEAAGLVAKGQAVNDLFQAKNLKFITKDPNREPTLYFRFGEQSGRLRQTHGGGPKIGMEVHKTDFFYSNEKDLDEFLNKMRTLRENHQAPGFLEWRTEQAFHGMYTAREGDLHLEITRDQHRIVRSTHKSGGRYSSKVDKYNEDWLRSNIWSVVGLAAGPDL